MSDKKQNKYKPFGYSPDVIKTNAEGNHVIDHDATDDYLIFSTVTNGKLIYTPKSNKYWAAPGHELTEEAFKKKVDFIRWKYDSFREEEKEESVEVAEEGKKPKKITKMVKTGRIINDFPATPENIEKKRKEIQMDMVKRGEQIDMAEVIRMTSPLSFRERPDFEARIKTHSYEDQVIASINGTNK